jgi:DNA-binding SARP family transcriptional activator/pimeloyl-ACP methyl ester carboxylesterase
VALSVLGPLAVNGPSGAVKVTGRKTREVLVLLALAAPRPLTAAALADRLWDEPPASAIKTVQAHVSRARAALAAAGGEAGRLSGGRAGYQLVAGPAQLDVLAVEDLRRRARVATLAGHDQDAAGWLGDARRTWRGEPELPATAEGDAGRMRLAEEHLQLTEDQLAAEIGAGRPADVVGELQALTARHPLRERLWELLMTALYRCGRQADAIAAYQVVRRHLRDEVGMEPGAALRALADGVLHHTLPATAPPEVAAAVRVPFDGPHYADADGVHVAWGAYGTGSTDVLLLNPTFVPVDAYLEESHLAEAIVRLTRGGPGRRVIAFDRRGLGLSDPATPATPPTLGLWTRDAVAVLDAAGAERVHVLANADTGMIALSLAATHPERVISVTVVNPYARPAVADDYPYGESLSVEAVLREIRTPDVRPPVDVLTWIAPSVATDARFRAWWDAIGRRAASPRTAGLVHQAIIEGDVRELLPLVEAPVLLLSRLDCPSHDPGHARYLVAHLRRATLAEHPDPNGVWFLGDVGWTLDRFDDFVASAGP